MKNWRSQEDIIYISGGGGDYDHLLVISITFFTSNDSCNPRLEYFNALAYVRVSSATQLRKKAPGNNDLKHDYGVAINGRCSGFKGGLSLCS